MRRLAGSKAGGGQDCPPHNFILGRRYLGRMLIAVGVFLMVLGLLTIARRMPPGLGHLPGDIYVRGKTTSFYFPIVTCLLLSAVLSLALWLVRR